MRLRQLEMTTLCAVCYRHGISIKPHFRESNSQKASSIKNILHLTTTKNSWNLDNRNSPTISFPFIKIYPSNSNSGSCNSQFQRNPHELSEDFKVYHSLFSVKYTPVVFLPNIHQSLGGNLVTHFTVLYCHNYGKLRFIIMFQFLTLSFICTVLNTEVLKKAVNYQ